MNKQKPLVLGIVGPTASGKTLFSMALARAMPVEIICMDSMQIYRGMDIGTAKPTRREQALVPHHMLDLVSPDTGYSVAEYQQEAALAIEGILHRKAMPLLVGGTGLYLWALSNRLNLGNAPRSEEIRSRFEALLQQHGREALHQHLRRVDPLSAGRLHPNDTRRVIRALEVYELTGQSISRQQDTAERAPWSFQLYAPDWPRELLYQRINERVEQMFSSGLVEEVRTLLSEGVSPESQSMQGLGYKELLPLLAGQSTLVQTVELLQRRTRNYAKRQLTWFRRDSRITWVPMPVEEDAFVTMVRKDIAQYEG
ncbi:MAG: tRNA (adenosine(37)-N6)-dimethylallyltransferase MiaA [Clostridiales bacterium]|nr:tRNA (adenosine(37)-N6)-dimethylallyltransferase MiaA [Clostridiales bacterium]